MRVAALRPLRHRDTRWVVAGATAWGVLDITIGWTGWARPDGLDRMGWTGWAGPDGLE